MHVLSREIVICERVGAAFSNFRLHTTEGRIVRTVVL